MNDSGKKATQEKNPNINNHPKPFHSYSVAWEISQQSPCWSSSLKPPTPPPTLAASFD